MSQHIQTPKVIAEYFGMPEAASAYIAQEFTPGRGWRTTSFRKRPSGAWARKLRGEKVTSVAIRCGDRLADFRVDELIGKTGLRG